MTKTKRTRGSVDTYDQRTTVNVALQSATRLTACLLERALGQNIALKPVMSLVLFSFFFLLLPAIYTVVVLVVATMAFVVLPQWFAFWCDQYFRISMFKGWKSRNALRSELWLQV